MVIPPDYIFGKPCAPRILPPLLFLVLDVFRNRLPFRHRTGHGGKLDGTGMSGGHTGLEPPAHAPFPVHYKGRGKNHGAAPMFLPFGADRFAQRTIGIADQPYGKNTLGVLPEGVMSFMTRLVELGILDGPLPELPPMLCGLGAGPDDCNTELSEPFVFINKGRNLGPAPRSPLAAVEKNHRGRHLLEDSGKLNRLPVDILEHRVWESRTDLS